MTLVGKSGIPLNLLWQDVAFFDTERYLHVAGLPLAFAALLRRAKQPEQLKDGKLKPKSGNSLWHVKLPLCDVGCFVEVSGILGIRLRLMNKALVSCVMYMLVDASCPRPSSSGPLRYCMLCWQCHTCQDAANTIANNVCYCRCQTARTACQTLFTTRASASIPR